MKTSIINARVRPELKGDVEQILSQLGITTTQAITMFFEQIRINRGIPFDLQLPNDETVQAMREARENKDLQVFEIEKREK
ncbi:MAG: type II toxin-antitoxin system RelB/DinJ family antitoxin [Thiomicrorhabdus sp.]|nr:type II toxin-antitoxin system RelB/DinJ family antitoxin [Thiomicrorhabdus sp.]